MSKYHVERQQWAHWPKTLVVVRDDGKTVERKRYVPASDGTIGKSDAAEAPSWAEIGAAKAENGALTARIEELEAELEAEREESAFLDAECDRLSVAIADMEQTHMKLPLDADGVPIRPGERLTFEMNDPGMCTGYDFMLREGRWILVVRDSEGRGGCRFLAADKARHVKPETVESLLQELADEVWEASCTCQTTWSDSGLDGIAERYAERVRKAMEHGLG